MNEALDSREIEPLSDGMYVKVHGHLKGFQGKKQLMIYSMRRVTGYNEIPNHFADCMYVHCYNTRTRKMQGAPQVTGQMPNSAVNTSSKGYQPTSADHEGIKGVDKLILDYLQQPSCVLVLIIELPLPQRKEWEGSPMQNREPCPDRIIDDLGGAFAMDSIGGAAYHFCKGLKSSPRGERFVGGIQAVPPKSAAASASGAASSPPLTAPSSSSATRRTPGTPSSPSPVPAASSACARA